MPHGELPAWVGDQCDQAFAISAAWILRQPPNIFFAVVRLVVRLIGGTRARRGMFIVHAVDRQATGRDVECAASSECVSD